MVSDDSKKSSVRSVGEFAEYLGLSRWTVSRVLNGHPGVHEDTRKRVLAEMERLHFQPNLMARGLRGTKTGLIGVCLQEVDSPILARKISGIQKSLHSRGLRGVIELTSGEANAEHNVINHFLSLQVDGIVLVGSVLEPDDSIFTRLKSEKTPVVAVDTAWNLPFPSVELDRQLAMLLCLRHLRQRGHDRFALLGLESDPVYGYRRIEGLRAAAARLELSWDDSFVSFRIDSPSGWSYRHGFEMAQELLQMESPPRGVIALNDTVAIGAIKAIREWGYDVPKDFAVVGFDNLPIGEWIAPGLTTIGQNVAELSDKAIKLLDSLSEGSEEEIYPIVKVQPKLIVRGST